MNTHPITLVPKEVRKRLGQRGNSRYVRSAIRLYEGRLCITFLGTRLFVEAVIRDDCAYVATAISGYMVGQRSEVLPLTYGRVSKDSIDL